MQFIGKKAMEIENLLCKRGPAIRPNFESHYLSNHLILQGSKSKLCLYRSADRYGPNPGNQATFYSGHKITVLIWLVCFSQGLSALDV